MSASDIAESLYLAGVAAVKEDAFAIAEAKFREAIRTDPDYADALRDLGWLLYGIFSKFDEALLYLEKAKDLDDSLAYLQVYLGMVMAKLGRQKEAEASFQKALLDPTDPALAHAMFADYLAGSRQHREAETHFVAALSIHPNMMLAHRKYAQLLASLGRNDEAEIHFTRALEIDPDDALTKRRYDEFCESQRRGKATFNCEKASHGRAFLNRRGSAHRMDGGASIPQSPRDSPPFQAANKTD